MAQKRFSRRGSAPGWRRDDAVLNGAGRRIFFFCPGANPMIGNRLWLMQAPITIKMRDKRARHLTGV
jgi:hypothetical protein